LSSLTRELLEKAKPYFQVYMKLSARCPGCGAPLVLKYRSNPERDYGRRLSVIIACSKACDKELWNLDVEEGLTHWWLDGTRDRETYRRIVESLPREEREIIKELERNLITLNILGRLD